MLFGQHPFFQNLRSFDGLASDNVYCCFQDKDGYLWFGTEMGVSRYDGYEFQNFDSEDGLTGNEIFQVFQDSQERIWMLSYNGEVSYFKGGSFYNAYNDPLLAKIKSDSYLSAFYESEDGKVYIGTGNSGVYVISPNDEVRHYAATGAISRIWERTPGEVLIFGMTGVQLIKNGILHELVFDEYGGSTIRTYVVNNQMYCVVKNQFCLLTSDNIIKPIFSLPENTDVTFIGKGEGSLLYMATRNGFYSVDLASNTITPDIYLPNMVSSYSLIDREGNLWITTLGEGVFLSTSPTTKFFDKESSCPLHQIACVGKGLNNELWIGLKNGRYVRLMDEQLSQYALKEHNDQSITEIKAINNKIYIVSKTAILIIDEGDTSYFTFLANDILVTDKHVYLASKQVQKIELAYFEQHLSSGPVDDELYNKEMLEKVILIQNAYALCEGNDGWIYIGTQTGLFAERNGEIMDFSERYEKLAASINDLKYDSVNNVVYVATNSQGLIVLKNNEVISGITTENNLSSNNCQTLLLDENQNLWVGTATSIDFLAFGNQTNPDIVNYGVLLNLSSTRIRDIEKIDQTLYLATDYGLIAHELNTTSTNSQILPDVFVTSVSVNSIDKNISDSTSLLLEHYENSVAFGFVGLSYKNLGNIIYEYKLDGHQDDWKTTKNTSVIFEALPPGKYTFVSRVVNSVGAHGNETSVSFQIEKPFWKTLWFSAGLFFGIIGILMLIWFFRIRRIRQHYELERQIVSTELEKLELEKSYLLAEQKAGVLQMNPHFLFNSLNTIKGYYAQNKFNEANRFISRFSRLLRRILECNTTLIPLEKELEILDLYLELMQKRYDNIFEFEIKCDVPNIKGVELPPMMIQPMVENAVIHGIAPLNVGKVVVRFYSENKQLMCTVTDNGIGFYSSHNQTHKSVGLGNIKDRLNLLSQQFDSRFDIDIISPNDLDKNRGTTIKIQFPIKLHEYESDNN